MKLGYFTDPHARADSPEGRNDDFRLSLYKKLEESGQIFNDEGVEVVLFGGDLFHTPDPSNSVIYDIESILKSWNKRIIGVVGSHDYFGYQIKSLKRTALGILNKAGIIELVGTYHEGTVDGVEQYIRIGDSVPSDGPRPVVICGTPHTYWLADDPWNFSEPRHDEDATQIQLVHGDLVHRPVPWKHVTIQQVHTESDIVLSGHVHPGWKDPWEIDDVVFFNPGSIARLENTGVQRTPRVLIVDTVQSSLKYRFRTVDLTSCERHPFKERVTEEEVVQDTTRLLELIKSTAGIKKVDVKAKIIALATELGYSQQVVIAATACVEEAETV